MKKNYFKLITLSFIVTFSFTAFAQTDVESNTKIFTADETTEILKQTASREVNPAGNVERMMAVCTNALNAPVAGGNNFDGNMFDVVVTNDVIVETFSVTVTATVNIAIYTRVGTFVGNQISSAGWIFLDSAVVVGAGPGVPVEVPVNLSYTMLGGSTHAFYVTATASGAIFSYTDGTAVGTVLASNSDLSILEGDGGQWPFNLNNSPRTFNGSLIYCLPIATNVNDVLTQENVSVYPNPASDELKISLPLNGVTTNISIYNVIGEAVFTENIIANGTTSQFDISNLKSGVYIVKIITDGSEYSTKLFVD